MCKNLNPYYLIIVKKVIKINKFPEPARAKAIISPINAVYLSINRKFSQIAQKSPLFNQRWLNIEGNG